jgi:hypothetical protein
MSFEDSTFERCPHDKENPYAQISRDLIRDKNVSFQTRGFLIYCLSYDGKWNISMPYFMKTQEIGKDRMYSMINEAIEAGYMKRIEKFEGGLKRYKYYVSEYPKFKESLLCAGFPDPVNPDPVFPDCKKEQLSSSKEEKKEQHKEAPTSSPPSADACFLYLFFLTKIRERFPDFKEPNRTKWEQHFERMLTIDKRPLDKIKELILWAAQDPWWKKACLSPEKLRAKYDDMSIAMLGDAENQLIQSNRAYAMEAKRSYPEQLKDLTFDKNYVMHRSAGKEISFKMQRDAFIEAFNITFGGS